MNDQTQTPSTTPAGAASELSAGLAVFPIPSCLRSPAQVQADAIRAWVATPEGKAELEKAGMDAKSSIRELEAARVIPWQDLQEPFTI
ncbi:MAG: hypothetical protein Q8M11_08840 [Sulfuritalea sp.]|nr:hypothetical protein [Sulfuritalea sp.]MDP1983999.1 hypothetical protein [Sulfuritalea sp.]